MEYIKHNKENTAFQLQLKLTAETIMPLNDLSRVWEFSSGYTAVLLVEIYLQDIEYKGVVLLYYYCSHQHTVLNHACMGFCHS